MRHFTGTENRELHKGIRIPFPDATEMDFRKAIAFANMLKPDILVPVLFGKDMSSAIRQAITLGFKNKTQIVVPNLTLGMAEYGGQKVMETVNIIKIANPFSGSIRARIFFGFLFPIIPLIAIVRYSRGLLHAPFRH